MPDNMGEAVVEVGLSFKKMDSQIGEVAKRLKPLEGMSVGMGAGPRQSAYFKEENKQYDEQIKKMHELLGISEKRAAVEKATTEKMGMADRLMMGMGAKNVGKGGMMGAQLSYAVQDFATGLAMGNMNMAIMGASNNIGMMFMQVSALAGGIATVGMSLLPLMITGIKALGSAEDDATARVEAMNKALDRRRQILELNARARGGLKDEEVDRMRGAEGIQKRIESNEKDSEEIKKQIAEKRAEADKLADESLKGKKEGGSLPANDPLVKYYHEVNGKVVEAQQKVRFVTDQMIEHQMKATQKAHERMGTSSATHRLETGETGGLIARRINSKEEKETLAKEAKKYADEAESLQVDLDRNAEDRAKLKKRRDEEAAREAKYLRDKELAGENVLAQKRIEIDRNEEREKFRIEESGMRDVLLEKPMTDKDFEAKQTKILKEWEDEKQANWAKEINEDRVRQRSGIMGPSKKMREQRQSTDEELTRRKSEELLEVERQKNNPRTLADEAQAANKANAARDRQRALIEEQRRQARMGIDIVSSFDKDSGRRLQIAADLKNKIDDLDKMNLTKTQKAHAVKLFGAQAMAELGNMGPRTHFAGIAELHDQMQSNITSNPMAGMMGLQNTAQNLLSTIQTMVTNGLKVLGAGVGP